VSLFPSHDHGGLAGSAPVVALGSGIALLAGFLAKDAAWWSKQGHQYDAKEKYGLKEDDDYYDPDAEQDDENVGMGYDDEGRPLGENRAEREMRDQAKVYFLQKLRRGEIDTLPEDPFQAYMDMLTQSAIDHEAETLRREIDEGQRGDSEPGYSISDLTDRLDSIKMGTGNKLITGRFNQEDKVIVKNSPELGVGTVYGVFPHKIDGEVANEMVYNVEFPNGVDEYYYDSELSFASKKIKYPKLIK